MKKFVISAILFCILVITMCLFFELYLLTLPNEYSYKRQYVEENGDKIKILVLGHSHTSCGVDPEFIGDSVFNMAIAGRNHYYDAVLAEKYIPGLKNLKCVIMPLGYNFQYHSYRYPCFIQKGGAVNYQNSYKCMYEKYMGINYPPPDLPYQYWSEIINSKLDYGNRVFSRIKGESDFEKLHSCTPSGFHRTSITSKSPKWETQILPYVVDYDNSNAVLAYADGIKGLKRIAKACHDNAVKLVVITTPCYRTYVNEVTERGLKEMADCLDSMLEVCPSMEYYNYMTDSRFGDDNDFLDGMHLTEIGAAKFSKILRDEVLFLYR